MGVHFRLPVGNPSGWSGIASGIVLFIGFLAIVGGLVEQPDVFIDPTVIYVGTAAVIVLAVSVGTAALARSRRRKNASQRRLPGKEPGDDVSGDANGGPGLELYQAEGCPFCRKVRSFCTDHGISIALHNPRTSGFLFLKGTVTNGKRHEELVTHGQDQIPLLVDNLRGESRYESDDIIAYLREHYT